MRYNKTAEMRKFYRVLHDRGMTVEKLAESIFSSRSHVTMVLNGSRAKFGSRHKTWKRLEPLLTQEEKSLLEQGSAWNRELEIKN